MPCGKGAVDGGVELGVGVECAVAARLVEPEVEEHIDHEPLHDHSAVLTTDEKFFECSCRDEFLHGMPL